MNNDYIKFATVAHIKQLPNFLKSDEITMRDFENAYNIHFNTNDSNSSNPLSS